MSLKLAWCYFPIIIVDSIGCLFVKPLRGPHFTSFLYLACWKKKNVQCPRAEAHRSWPFSPDYDRRKQGRRWSRKERASELSRNAQQLTLLRPSLWELSVQLVWTLYTNTLYTLHTTWLARAHTYSCANAQILQTPVKTAPTEPQTITASPAWQEYHSNNMCSRGCESLSS